jgi:hypothetical protein
MVKEFIQVKKITMETEEEKIVYDKNTIKNVFKAMPDERGRLHLGTKNKVVVIELQGEIQ